MKLGVGEFKARCLALIEDLHLNGGQIVLTKRGRPMVVVQPWEDREAAAPTRLGIVMKEDWR
jgi:antitoxin (DNA-binding transcriptional repressor) of toxin-antitoxin stability system